MTWRIEDVVDGAVLNLSTGIHHEHLVRDPGNDTQVVGDQDDRRLRALLDSLEDVEDLRRDLREALDAIG